MWKTNPKNQGNYLSAIGCFRLQVVECDKLPEQAALLVTSLHPAKLKIRLWLEEDEPQVDGKASHVDGKGPMGVKHRLPAVDLTGCIDLGGFVPQATHKSHRPHRNLPSRSHLARGERGEETDKGRQQISQLKNHTWQRNSIWASAAGFTAEHGQKLFRVAAAIHSERILTKLLWPAKLTCCQMKADHTHYSTAALQWDN